MNTVVGIRTKLFLTVLALAVPAIVLVGVLSYLGGKAAVEQTTLERLTAVRAGKANQIEEYFNEIRSLARIFARDRMIVDARRSTPPGFVVPPPSPREPH